MNDVHCWCLRMSRWYVHHDPLFAHSLMSFAILCRYLQLFAVDLFRKSKAFSQAPIIRMITDPTRIVSGRLRYQMASPSLWSFNLLRYGFVLCPCFVTYQDVDSSPSQSVFLHYSHKLLNQVFEAFYLFIYDNLLAPDNPWMTWQPCWHTWHIYTVLHDYPFLKT